MASQHASRRVLLALLAVAVWLWAAKYHPFLAAPRIIDDDARQHVYWTYRFQDPELFRDDLLTRFISSPQIAPLGYQALYAVAARLMDPLLFSQVLSLFLLLLAAAWLFQIGQRLGGVQGGTCVVLLFLPYFLYSSSGGLPKSFGFPLLFGAIALALRGAFGALAGMLVVQSVCYPPILLNSVALAAVTWWRSWRQGTSRHPWWQLTALGLGVGLAGATLLGVYAWMPQPAFGPMITPAVARTMPEFGPSGRTAFYGSTLLQTLLNDRAGIGAERLYGFLGIIGLIYLLRWPRPLAVPAVVQDLAWTSLGLFLVAHGLLFKLHLPSRYVLYTWPTAALLLIAAHTAEAVTAVLARWPACRQWGRWWAEHRAYRWVGAGLLALTWVYVQQRYVVTVDPLTVRVDRTALQLYRYLQTLPKDVVIAGHPLEMDNVPLFARRKVLANQELSLPYLVGYYSTVRQRLGEMLLAYYAADVRQVEDFVARYNVDYILLNTAHFEPTFVRGAIYYEPFNSLVKERLSPQGGFALRDALLERRVYAVGPYVVVSFTQQKKGAHGSPQD